MNVFKRFLADRYARNLQTSRDGVTPDARASAARDRLLSMGSDAVRSVLDSLEGKRADGPALEVLDRLLTNDTLPSFIAALKSPDAAVADTVTDVLSRGQQYDPTMLLPLFSDTDIPKSRIETILSEQMRSLQPRTLLQLLPDLSKDARGSVFRLLEKRADNTIASDVVRLAVSTEWWLRLHMVKLLARMPGRESRETVTKLLRDENPMVRLEAVRALSTLKDPQAIEGLCGRLRDPDMKVQGAAIEALIAIGDVRAVAFLLEYLRDESEYVRRGAVEVLNQVVTVEAVKDLVSALRDQDWWVRVRAADALGTLGGDRVVEAVMSLLDDQDEFVRRYAVEILNMVPDGRSVEPLIHALDDEDWWVRERAIDALGKVGDARAVDPLLRMIGRDSRLIPLCTRALGAIGDERAVEPLCRLAASDNDEVRSEAVNALTRLSKKELSKEARTTISTTFESLGVTPGRGAGARIEARSNPATSQVPSESERVTPRSDPASAAKPAPTPPARNLNFQRLDPGDVLVDRWRVLRHIGGGGFGTVYLVEDVFVKEEMVLKVLSPHLSQDESMIKRFVQELRLARRITHRNVIRIHDLVDLGGAHAISMEYFRGSDLGQIMRANGPLPVDRALLVTQQVLQGLASAHALGIYHRDIKPANILVGDSDEAKIVDFGLASVGHSAHSRLTQTGILIGTPEYISPEQITGKEIDGRADLYSLGCVLYYVLSGQEPFTGDTAVNVIFQHLEGQAPALMGVAPVVTEALSDYITRVLSKEPDQRPASALEMSSDLERLREAA